MITKEQLIACEFYQDGDDDSTEYGFCIIDAQESPDLEGLQLLYCLKTKELHLEVYDTNGQSLSIIKLPKQDPDLEYLVNLASLLMP